VPRPSFRSIVIATTLILSAQLAGSYALGLGEESLVTPGLRELPGSIGVWTLTREDPLPSDVTNYLRPDEYVQRWYEGDKPENQVSLFVAFFRSLQNNYGPHSPKVCLPGSGWLVRSSKVAQIAIPGRTEPLPANQYLMEQNDQRILVLYWYQNSRRAWAEEFEFKLHLLPDLLKYHRSDVSLVRIVAPVASSDSFQVELDRATTFAQKVYPMLVEHFGRT
jgi:EpsI family protein